MKLLRILIAMLIMTSACKVDKNCECVLTGYLMNAPDSSIINLVDVESGIVFHKVYIKDGIFNLRFSLTNPKYFSIYKDGTNSKSERLFLWLENSTIEINGDFENLANSKVTGSASNNIYTEYLTIEKDYKKIKDANLYLFSNMTTTEEREIDSINILTENLLARYKPAILKFYSDNIKSEVAFHYLYKEPKKYMSALNKSDYKNLIKYLPKEKLQSSEGILLEEYSNLPEVPQIGEKFVDISQSTPEGESESISSNLGKYTILEFWSSKCPLSSWTHSRLIDVYNLYHDKGLNIIGISGDWDYDEWQMAIQNDSIPWVNISDLNGWYNKAFLTYGIYYTPNLILLNENGIIEDNQFFHKWIENELETRFK